MKLHAASRSAFVALTLLAIMPTIGTAASVPLDGSLMRLADSPNPQGRRNLVALIDGDVDLSAVDPRITGATISLGPDAGPATVIELPASGWTQTGNAPRIDFKYKSDTGPVRAARLIDGRSIRFTAKGEGAYALAGVPQGAVAIVMAIGDSRFCGAFGGTVVRDDGQRFVARNAPAPAACSSFGVPTTSTTTTSTTTSTTTTTRPYSVVQTYSDRCVPFNYLTFELNLPAASFDDAYATCVARCDSDPSCVEIWVAYACDTKAGPYSCLTGAVGSSSKGWNASEIQCGYPPIAPCAGWYGVAVP